MAAHNLGALVILSPPEEGDIFWVAEQTEVTHNLPPSVYPKCPVDWDWRVFKVNGYVDNDTFDIGFSVSITGINVGNIFGNLKDGVGLKVDLSLAKGKINFDLKNGTELWIRLAIDVKQDNSYAEYIKIMSF